MTHHPFDPQDFPINTSVKLQPTQIFYLKGCIHFKTTAQIQDLTGRVSEPWKGDFSPAFLSACAAAARGAGPAFEISSCGNMMRTIKTMTDAASGGGRVCDLNITFVSFGSSTVRFPAGSPHCRHEVELCPVGDGRDEARKHEAFVKNSIPYFWDMTAAGGNTAVLYKALNQQRVEIARVAGYGFDKDAVLVLNGRELDHVVALATAVILLNGRDAMDSD
ncbi:hypothetical protein F4780DRAFT_278036 [Xylariomycetidae sp. FL0641]|nr:hypothetical protein F4780DRAFT_278036 [Xylariomycetidae sp. FL0641]